MGLYLDRVAENINLLDVKKSKRDSEIERLNEECFTFDKKVKGIYPLEIVDRKIESYLTNEKGFKRIESLPWTKDILRTLTRDVKRNPLFISEEGYGFKINPASNDDRYDFRKFKPIKNLDSRIVQDFYSDFDPGTLLSTGTLSFIGAEITAEFLGLDSSLLFAVCIGGLGLTGSFFYEVINHFYNNQKIQSEKIAQGNYDVIPKLLETLE